MTPSIFNFNDAPVRSHVGPGYNGEHEIWFNASDVCAILDVGTEQTRRLDGEEKGLFSTQTPGGSQMMLWVNESGLYSLILGSRKPEARAFKKWVTSEVLPAIRKTGTYSVPAAPAFAIPATFADALQLAADQARQLDAAKLQLADAAPKLKVYDQLASADGLFNFRQVTAMLPGLKMGSNLFVKKLIEDKVLYRDNKGKILAYREHIDAGRFRGKETVYEHKETHESRVSVQIMVTQTGLEWLAKKYDVAIVADRGEAA